MSPTDACSTELSRQPLTALSLRLAPASVRPGPNRCFVNIDLASTPMYMPGDLSKLLIALACSKVPRFGANDLAATRISPQVYITVGRCAPCSLSCRTGPDAS